jgi:hypothetical protein
MIGQGSGKVRRATTYPGWQMRMDEALKKAAGL